MDELWGELLSTGHHFVIPKGYHCIEMDMKRFNDRRKMGIVRSGGGMSEFLGIFSIFSIWSEAGGSVAAACVLVLNSHCNEKIMGAFCNVV